MTKIGLGTTKRTALVKRRERRCKGDEAYELRRDAVVPYVEPNEMRARQRI
jgi:hypothetical protein